MIYLADLHVHSKYSRATSPQNDLPNLARWAAIKGIDVVATGDFTHPLWRSEIMEFLEPDGTGLFRIKDSFNFCQDSPLPREKIKNVRFILNVEISSIYKKDGKVRKIHNLVFMPDFESMILFCSRLQAIGNLNSDGRPILGLPSRDLLEIALETSPESFVIPAHIWTPWFSLMGSKSGFDSVQQCFEDLSSHIFALETGLSSDPDMNRRISSLDNYTLVSNSDTHSAPRLGRELNIFTGLPSYYAIRDSLKKGGLGNRILESSPVFDAWKRLKNDLDLKRDSFLGTIEFFPEEGKYHWDGHRKCNFRSNPSVAGTGKSMCPVCGNPITVGVMSRVCELADRIHPIISAKSGYFWRTIPLLDVIAAVLNVGSQSRKVERVYFEMIAEIGPETSILWDIPIEEIAHKTPERISQAIEKVRKQEVVLEAGFDGEYGKIKIPC